MSHCPLWNVTPLTHFYFIMRLFSIYPPVCLPSNMHEGNIFFNTSDFPHLILQLQLGGWFGRVGFYFTPIKGVVFQKHFDD